MKKGGAALLHKVIKDGIVLAMIFQRSDTFFYQVSVEMRQREALGKYERWSKWSKACIKSIRAPWFFAADETTLFRTSGQNR
jgi:hypothetical protein